jgi:exopolysaccharide biosynthesis polyprenyl glycosylphosphotransferase
MERELDRKLFLSAEEQLRVRFGGEKAAYLALKRMLDVVMALGLLILLVPLFAVIALGIKLYSPGPILFRQQRIGKDGKEFTFLKFRSMRHNADTMLHRQHISRQILENRGPKGESGASLKLKDDPRITGLGRILRRTSLDELPQIFNVLRGDMSIVGPRPPIPYEVELYKEWHKQRFAVLPGITGLWQVEGRNRVNFDEMVRMDMHYIQHMSLWLDLQIILKTPLAMIVGKGAG